MQHIEIPLRNSIRGKILISVIGVITSIVILFALFDYKHYHAIMDDELETRIAFMKASLVESEKSIANQLVLNIEASLSSFNFSNVIERLKNVVQEREELKYAILIDQSGKVLVTTISSGYKSLFSDTDIAVPSHIEEAQTHEIEKAGNSYLEFIVPVSSGSVRWGILKLGYSLERLKEISAQSHEQNDQKNLEMVIQSLLISLVFILFGSVIVLYYANRFSSPLIELSKQAQRLSKGDFTSLGIIPKNRSDEIGILNSSFHKMSRDLKVSYETLETYSHSLELKVKERTQSLETLLKELKESQEQLVQAEKMAALGGLVAGLAHEINTPIGIGVTAASYFHTITKDVRKDLEGDRLKRSEFDRFINDADECSCLILSNLQRTASLVNSFKMVASDQTSEEKRKFNLKEYCEDIIVSLTPQIKMSRIQVEVLGESDIEIYSYPGSIAQIISNLVLNAIIHAFEDDKKGTISIRIERKNDEIIIKVEDDGKGINKKDLKKIFDPFYTTKRGQGGTGLGLHIVFNIVHSTLKSKIACKSSLGQGTCFTINMPESELC